MTTLSRISGCLTGIIIGDAMGMSVEKKTRDFIATLNEGRGVVGFMPSFDDHFRSYAAGDTTDDWQLARAVIRSIIRCGGFDLEDVAREHVVEWHPDTTTWGKTTHKAIADIKFGHRLVKDPLPALSGAAGSSSGVMMKVAGLSILHALRKTSEQALAADVMALGSLTHGNPVSSTTAYAVAEIIRLTLLDQPISVSQIAKTCRSLSDDREFPDLLDRVETMSIDELHDLPHKKFSAIYCAMVSIGLALRMTDFREGVLTAVNLGGDADTNASIVGSILGARYGYEAIPSEWADFKLEYREAAELGEALTKSAQ